MHHQPPPFPTEFLLSLGHRQEVGISQDRSSDDMNKDSRSKKKSGARRRYTHARK
jgi:hypothetical protein